MNIKRYDGHNYPSHWEMIRPMSQASPLDRFISHMRTWNFEDSVWEIKVWGSQGEFLAGCVENQGYVNGKPVFRHSFQTPDDERRFESIDDCQAELVASFMMVERL